ncbi:hypothetical protein EYC84_003260 [Monilinia fructicola]|uniref:Uncharacterized protein n=1 Tax=Monilinia fructicola TaxID=38448 RepID=A0A5M9JXP8_MONFR|nr:hypothetical protein EYC84_003260 [Monilinia fructicola]
MNYDESARFTEVSPHIFPLLFSSLPFSSLLFCPFQLSSFKFKLKLRHPFHNFISQLYSHSRSSHHSTIVVEFNCSLQINLLSSPIHPSTCSQDIIHHTIHLSKLNPQSTR